MCSFLQFVFLLASETDGSAVTKEGVTNFLSPFFR